MGLVFAPGPGTSLSPVESEMALAVAGVLGAVSDAVSVALATSSPSQVVAATDWAGVNAAADVLVPIYARVVGDEARAVEIGRASCRERV